MWCCNRLGMVARRMYWGKDKRKGRRNMHRTRCALNWIEGCDGRSGEVLGLIVLVHSGLKTWRAVVAAAQSEGLRMLRDGRIVRVQYLHSKTEKKNRGMQAMNRGTLVGNEVRTVRRGGANTSLFN
ncbi:hypothetical protein K438DRAFT_1776132 [Mycena galopus ATCC 62051]|nr:hypothetical protein K438DRAFT_1776132 [Mycena galopus ATCC 62051]